MKPVLKKLIGNPELLAKDGGSGSKLAEVSVRTQKVQSLVLMLLVKLFFSLIFYIMEMNGNLTSIY